MLVLYNHFLSNIKLLLYKQLQAQIFDLISVTDIISCAECMNLKATQPFLNEAQNVSNINMYGTKDRLNLHRVKVMVLHHFSVHRITNDSVYNFRLLRFKVN